MNRNCGISLTFLVLYLVFFAHAAIPHVHESHDPFSPVCCGLFNSHCDNETHHHIPDHSECQYDDFCISPASDDCVAHTEYVFTLADESPSEISNVFLSQTAIIQFRSDPPPLLDRHKPGTDALRAPPAA